ncbi:MAG: TfuA-like protein [Myxococcaceae bacterium]
MSRLIVFLGPTLRAAEAKKLARCDVRPPARQGDVWRALLARPKAIALIDGVFESQPSVWHQEIRAALASGVAVFGSSSMGALRAAELAPYGMIGVGKIFQSYASGARVDDADVALLHANAEHAFKALTVPMVNVEHAAGLALKAKKLSRPDHRALLRLANATHYTRRTWRPLLEAVAEKRRGAFAEFLAREKPDLKADDARACLKAAEEFVASGAPAPKVELPRFASHVRRARLVATGALSGDERLEGEETDAGTRTLLLARLADQYGAVATDAEIAQVLRRLPKGEWAEDERREAARAIVLERKLLDAPERVFADGPARLEGLAFQRRVRRGG